MSTLLARLRTRMVALPLAAALGACHAWSHQPIPAPESAHVRGGPLRPTHTGGPPIVLAGVAIDRDSLFERGPAAPYGRAAIAASEGWTGKARRVDPLVVIGVAALVAIAAILWMNLTHDEECSCAPPPP